VTTSDKNLLAQLLSDNSNLAEKSWSFLYREYYPMARTIVLRNNGTDADAVDVFQDALLIFNRNLKAGTFREESSIKTYLYSICHNLWLKEIEKRKKTSSLAPDLHDEADSGDADYLQHTRTVGELMNQLQEDCKKVLTEFYYNKRTMAELKDMFQLNSIQAAKNKKWRCLSYLTKLYKEKEGLLKISGNG